ncbi:DUF6163 family protein [Salinarimonas soli]|uniref:DoxX family protein n=1 Tax=Salinarimonas soli TaxID=1638099 RepID=A0A5B2VFV1_9HYPH|nr:DUF6163 family protein [Salinarimonas soli]KAA2238001.1 hypothetical protein F0L46_06940 [Salinarimonas soli]
MRRLSRQRAAPVPAGDAALRRREEPKPRAVRWNLTLVWFMRVMSLLWIAKGLSFWALIVGAGYGPSFEEKGLGFQTTIVYFAVVDPIAAVGLWLTSAWGGVLWLLAIMSQLILWFFFPNLVPGNLVTAIVYGGFISAYLILSWLAARDEDA